MTSEPEAVNDSETYSPKASGPARSTKYYKQAYRTEWESMPDFKGWLRDVPGSPTRAYCKYCEKTLHAHRLSLLKHTCTLKHTNAAQKSYLVQTAASQPGRPTISAFISRQQAGPSRIVAPQPRDAAEGNFVVADPLELSDKEPSEAEQGAMQSEEESMDEEVREAGGHDDKNSSRGAEGLCEVEGEEPPSKVARVEMDDSPLSTHVLDTARGNAVNGLHVSLYKLIEGRWTALHEGITTPDGRYTEFIKRKDFTAGRYKLHFDVDRYFELRSLEALYPFVEIVFDVKKPSEHYHVPLLISPYGYTTYRGS